MRMAAGGFDRFKAIREVCDRHILWMHVDAAWGVGAKFTPQLDSATEGMELADSLAWDGHKVGMPRAFVSARARVCVCVCVCGCGCLWVGREVLPLCICVGTRVFLITL